MTLRPEYRDQLAYAIAYIPEDSVDAIARYADLAVEVEETGETTAAVREEMRSYACEALRRILMDNGDVFDFADRIAAARARRERR